MIFAARGRDGIFLLRYRLFLYQQWLVQTIEKGWRKFFEIMLFPQFPQNDGIYKKKYYSLFQHTDRTIASTEINDPLKERSNTGGPRILCFLVPKGITKLGESRNQGTLFWYKTPNWVQNFSKVHFLSLFFMKL